MTVAIAPTDYLAHHLNPLSQAINSFGGPHILLGVIASDGAPHMYLTGNVDGNLKKEMYEALADLLRRRATEIGSVSEGSTLV